MKENTYKEDDLPLQALPLQLPQRTWAKGSLQHNEGMQQKMDETPLSPFFDASCSFIPPLDNQQAQVCASSGFNLEEEEDIREGNTM